MRLWWVLVVAGLVCCIGGIGAQEEVATSYWISDSLTRIRTDTTPGSATTLTLYMGRREARSCQISLRSTGTTTRYVTVDDDAGLTVELFKEQYVYLTTGSAQSSYYYNKGGGPGWWPDGLTPFTSGGAVDLTANKNETIWVDITVPADTVAGDKTVTITAGSQAFTITVVVGDFSLPERPVMGSLFRYLVAANRESDGNNLLRKHRLLPMYQSVADSRNQDWVSCSFHTSKNADCTAKTPILSYGALTWDAAVAAKKATFAPIPSGTTVYSYSLDEPYPYCSGNASLQATMSDYADALHASDVLMLVTMPPLVPGWEFLDIAVVLPKFHDQDDIDAFVAAGGIAWSYNCLNQDRETPKWLLDMDPINYRIFGFLNHNLGYTGLLYWACDNWTATPWTDVSPIISGLARPGEGILVYPATGTPAGDFTGTVLPSMRLKQLRDASQDYDLVWLCEQAGLGTEAAAAIAGVGSAYTWGSWTTNKEVIKQAQIDLEVLLNPPPTPPTAAFTGTPTSGTAPLTVLFSDTSVDATSWAWTFGDGGTSTSQSPSYEYAAAGTYTVTLTATNAAGADVETKAGYIIVSVAVLPPVADFTATPTTGDAPLTVAFSDASAYATSWSWDFGDGDTSVEQSPSHQYAAEGRYTVTLTVSNAADNDTKTMTDYIIVGGGIDPPDDGGDLPDKRGRGRGRGRA